MNKLILLICSLLISIITVSAQKMKNAPTRSVLKIYQDSKFEIIPDEEAKKYYSYPLSLDNAVVKVWHNNPGVFNVFIATKNEFYFLSNELQKNNVQILLDDEKFVGFMKTISY